MIKLLSSDTDTILLLSALNFTPQTWKKNITSWDLVPINQ